MSITLYEFNSLSHFEKGEVLWESGVHLSERFIDNVGYSLYQLNNFYVEVKYQSDKNKITLFRSFKNDTLLEPYLNQIDLSKLRT